MTIRSLRMACNQICIYALGITPKHVLNRTEINMGYKYGA